MHACMWPVTKLLGLSCRQIAQLASLRLDRPLSFNEKLRLTMHSVICGICRPLPRQLDNLRTLARRAGCCDGHDEAPAEVSDEDIPAETCSRIRAALEREN
jgi:hypothetical protein